MSVFLQKVATSKEVEEKYPMYGLYYYTEGYGHLTPSAVIWCEVLHDKVYCNPHEVWKWCDNSVSKRQCSAYLLKKKLLVYSMKTILPHLTLDFLLQERCWSSVSSVIDWIKCWKE